MAKFVPDMSSRRWVIISQGRAVRPTEAGPRRSMTDPFAEGNEAATSDEVFRIGKGVPNKPGWDTRVVPNKYPITDTHEVFVHSPDPRRDVSEMQVKEIAPILHAYRARFNFYREKGTVMIFCNFGTMAGASISHPHSQLVLLPPQINMDSLDREAIANVVYQSDQFTAYCPEFSQWPYELWVAPRREDTYFGDSHDEELEELADIMRVMLKRLRKIHRREEFAVPFSYNYYVSPHKNWYLRIVPRFVHRAGFELGTGLSVNIVDPLDAALAYQNIDPHTDELLRKLDERAHEKLDR